MQQAGKMVVGSFEYIDSTHTLKQHLLLSCLVAVQALL
jgi:hypothetical protein